MTVIRNEESTNMQRASTALHLDTLRNPVPCGSSGQESPEQYWEAYYTKQTVQTPPSQFAAFVAGEHKDHSLYIDIGCGNARDSLFFSYLGHDIIGIDKSASAIEFCKAQVLYNAHKLSAFIACDISDLSLEHPVLSGVARRKKLIYSRFFLHAIEEHKEDALFEFLADLCQHPEDVIALEFRTTQDAHNAKLAKAHFRRFLDPEQLRSKLEHRFKLRVNYLVQGYGMAKFASEDAHVCRMLIAPAV